MSTLKVKNEILTPKEYQEEMRNQGRRPTWVAKQLDITYQFLNMYYNEKANMAEHRVVKLHELLFGVTPIRVIGD